MYSTPCSPPPSKLPRVGPGSALLPQQWPWGTAKSPKSPNVLLPAPRTPGWVAEEDQGLPQTRGAGDAWGNSSCSAGWRAGRGCPGRRRQLPALCLWVHMSPLAGKMASVCPPPPPRGPPTIPEQSWGWGGGTAAFAGQVAAAQAQSSRRGWHRQLLLWVWSRNVSTTSTIGLNNSHCGKLHSKNRGRKKKRGRRRAVTTGIPCAKL